MKQFKITIRAIIDSNGGDFDNDDLYLDIDSGRDHIEDLSIERHDEELIVCQYYTQRGDLMRDPQVRFDISGDGRTAIEYRDDPHTHKIDNSGLSIDDFLARWSTNLQDQFL